MLHYVKDWNKVDALYYSWQSFKENPQNPFLKGLALAFAGLILLESALLLAGKGVLVGIRAAAEAIFIREVALAGAIAIGTAIKPKKPLLRKLFARNSFLYILFLWYYSHVLYSISVE